MYDLHSKLKRYHDEYVRLGQVEQAELAGYRDTNLQRLNAGLDKLSEENDRSYAHPIWHCDQGGYAMSTLNQHPDKDYDLDEGIVFRKDDLPAGALETRKQVAEAMNKGGGNFARKPEARTNAITVWYAEGYHIDLAVYREYKDYLGHTVIEHAGVDWTARNPFEITNWFTEQVATLSPSKDRGATVEVGQMRRVVRLLKAFSKSREGWKSPGGLIISTLVAECFQPHAHRDDVALYLTMVRIRNRLQDNLEVLNPVDPSQKLTCKTKYSSQVKRFRTRLDEAIEKHLYVLNENGCTESKALRAWHWVFQHSFWLEGLLEEGRRLSEPSAAEPIAFGDLQIRAELSPYPYGPIWGCYPSASRLLPKGIWLRFSFRTSLGLPHQVRWIVKNYGDEAEEESDEDYRFDGTAETQWESTRYKGCHTMICELHNDGILMARAKHLVRIQGR